MAIVNNFDVGELGENYTPNSYAEYGGMIGKVAEQVIRGLEGKNPLAVFDKMPIDKGDTVEQAIVKLVEASGYDATGEGTLAPDTREKMAVRYFKNWQHHLYKTTVRMDKIRKVIMGEYEPDTVADLLVSALAQSRIHDKYQSLKALLLWGTTDDSSESEEVGEVAPILVKKDNVDVLTDGSTDYKGILKQIKNIVSGMQFVNADFNRAGLLRATRAEDIFIIMPYTLKNAIDVDELAGVFNLDKAELRSKIIEIDDTENNYVYIVDRYAILDYTRLYEMQDQKNAEGLFWNYFLHIDDMFGISPLFDGCFFEYDTTPAEDDEPADGE